MAEGAMQKAETGVIDQVSAEVGGQEPECAAVVTRPGVVDEDPRMWRNDQPYIPGGPLRPWHYSGGGYGQGSL